MRHSDFIIQTFPKINQPLKKLDVFLRVHKYIWQRVDEQKARL